MSTRDPTPTIYFRRAVLSHVLAAIVNLASLSLIGNRPLRVAAARIAGITKMSMCYLLDLPDGIEPS